MIEIILVGASIVWVSMLIAWLEDKLLKPAIVYREKHGVKYVDRNEMSPIQIMYGVLFIFGILVIILGVFI